MTCTLVCSAACKHPACLSTSKQMWSSLSGGNAGQIAAADRQHVVSLWGLQARPMSIMLLPASLLELGDHEYDTAGNQEATGRGEVLCCVELHAVLHAPSKQAAEGVLHLPSSWQVVVGVGMLVYLKGTPGIQAHSGFSCRGGGLRNPAAAAAGTVPWPRDSSLSQVARETHQRTPCCRSPCRECPDFAHMTWGRHRSTPLAAGRGSLHSPQLLALL